MRPLPLALQCLAILVASSLQCLAAQPPAATPEADLRAKIEDLLRESLKYLSGSSRIEEVVRENPAYAKLIAMGPRCVPFIRKAVREDPRNGLFHLWVIVEIIKVRPQPSGGLTTDIVANWLDARLSNAYERASKEFARLNAEWNEMKKKGEPLALWHDVSTLDPSYKWIEVRRKFTPIGQVYKAIQDQGIFVLPELMAQLKSGNYDFLPIVQYLTDGRAHNGNGIAEDRAKKALAWWEEHKSEWIVPMPQQ